MKRHTSRNSHRDEKPKPSRNEDSGAVVRARTEEERRRRRRNWMIEQEKMVRHNRLKRRMAMEYELRRARNMGLALPEGRCNRPRRSRSESPPSQCRRTSAHHTPKDTVLSKKFETPSGTTPLFKGSEGTKINPIELHKIKVDIHRNILGRVTNNELKRDIPNKEDVVLKRRAGEGSKPIFDREEIKRAIGETKEVEEHRNVVTVNLENSENKLKRNLASLSPTRTRNHSPRRTWSRYPRYDDSKHEDKASDRSDREEEDHSRERKDGERSYRDHRERSRDHSRGRKQTDRSRERDRPREQRVPLEHYIQPIPIYYGNFQQRPLMVQPWGPIRGPLGSNIHPPMMRPLRTFPSQSIGIPPDMYGFRPPLNPHASSMFICSKYSLLSNTENAHEDSIWTCAWGCLKKKKEAHADNEDSRDSVRSNEEETVEYLVTGSVDDTVKVWEQKDKGFQLKHKLTGHSLGVVSVAVSSDGSKCASSSLDSSLRLWDVDLGEKISSIEVGPVDIWTVVFSPDNKFIVSGSHSGKIHLYGTESGKQEQTLDTRGGKFTLSVAYSPDGKYIASGAIDGIINIFDVTYGRVLRTLEGHAMPIRSLCFSPDSQLLLTASDDGHMKLYDVKDANLAGTMSGHASWVLGVAFSPDGQNFASSSSDHTVKVWELAQRQCLHTFNEHNDQVWAVKYNPQRKNIIASVSEDKSINLYECPMYDK